MPNTILHTACSVDNRGDFSSAVNVAMTLLDTKPEFSNGKEKLILSSNKHGLAKLKEMYGNETTSNQLTINGHQIEVYELSELATKTKEESSFSISAFVQVGECKLPPSDLVSQVCHDTNTKILFVSLPHRRLEDMEGSVISNYAPLLKTNPVSILSLGLTDKHLGVDLHIENIQSTEINNSNLSKFAEEKFGVIYSSGNPKKIFRLPIKPFGVLGLQNKIKMTLSRVYQMIKKLLRTYVI